MSVCEESYEKSGCEECCETSVCEESYEKSGCEKSYKMSECEESYEMSGCEESYEKSWILRHADIAAVILCMVDSLVWV